MLDSYVLGPCCPNETPSNNREDARRQCVDFIHQLKAAYGDPPKGGFYGVQWRKLQGRFRLVVTLHFNEDYPNSAKYAVRIAQSVSVAQSG